MNPVYWKLTKFFLPLAITSTLKDVGEQFLKRSLASSTDAVLELASFAIAFRIFTFLNGTIDEFKFISIVLLKSNKDRRKIIIFAVCFALIPFLSMIVIGVTPLGHYVIEMFHDVDENVGNKSRTALLLFSFYPVLDAIAFVHFGVLIRYKYSIVCALSSILDVAGKIIAVTIALAVKSSLNVLYIPLMAMYVGILIRLPIILFAYYKWVHHRVCEDTNEQDPVVSMYTILTTFLPLLVSRSVQRVSRPLLNLFVARDRRDGVTQSDSLEALAILSIIYPMGRTLYGYLNEAKVIESTFTKKDESGRSDATVRQARLFIFMTLCVSILLNITFFWIPPVTIPVVMGVADVSMDLAEKASIPLKIYSFHCLPVFFRDTTIGWLLKVKRTSPLYISGVCRIIVILVLVNVFPIAGFHGAPMATAALLIGFCVESTMVLISAYYIKRLRKREALHEEREVLALQEMEAEKPV